MKPKSKLLHLFGLAISPFSVRVFGEVTLGFHTHSPHDDHGQSSSSGLSQKSLGSALLSFHTTQGRSTVDREKTKIPSHPLAKKGGGAVFVSAHLHRFSFNPQEKWGFPQSPGCPSCLLFVFGSLLSLLVSR